MVANPSFLPPWKRKKDSLTAGQTKTVFQRSLSSFRSIEMIMSLSNSTEDKTKQVRMTIIVEDGAITDSIGRRLGASPSVNINTIVDSGDLKVNITNNETYTVGVNFIYTVFKTII